MSLWIAELKLIFRSKFSVFSLIFLLLISTCSVYLGIKEIYSQQQTIEYLKPIQAKDVALVAKPFQNLTAGGNAGTAAYYTFHYTWDAPNTLAFAALGLRDVAPYILRIRALGLQAQLYEGETLNPELVLQGHFDFAFVLIYLSPLFLIALLHDLISIEKQSGRLNLLKSFSQFGYTTWLKRTFLRYALTFLALVTPFIFAAIYLRISIESSLIVILISLIYLAFWLGLCLLVLSRAWSAVTSATTLVSLWVILTLILPTISNLLITRQIPVAQGIDLMLEQRQAIHSAWEIPREDTMQQFFVHHPEWKDTAPLAEVFHWKWYFAFHQVGDERVASKFTEYRASLLKRQQWTEHLGWFLPSVATQTALHRLAQTDLKAQLTHQDQVIEFHKKIREHYYPYLFNEKPYFYTDFDQRPVFQAVNQSNELNIKLMLSVLICALFMLIIGLLALKLIQSY
ncbi:DUF3526 domain-containing protein [Acinetobacter sp. Marseille-Q1618]|uniref:DUF3526 domain-containing protein n=1 Tax=Acinetobacter sp. Marseille-Q1618 TaxID=2697502 RepID=UPI00157125C3|nr:DUF3526 domain-containing protein [Acinetobacter sp. Marseille-Q1618]